MSDDEDDVTPPEIFVNGGAVAPPALPPSPEERRAARLVLVDEAGNVGDWRDRLVYKGRSIDPCVANAITIFSNDPEWRDVLAWDEFAQSLLTLRAPPWAVDDRDAKAEAGAWTDVDTVRAQAWMMRKYQGIKLGKDAILDAITVTAARNAFHPVKEWLEPLAWDATKRVDSWLTTYLGVEPTEYSRAVGRWFLIGAVARIYDPGCKVDTMLILEGPQGRGKSTALRVLFNPWFSDTPLELGNKDRFVGLRGAWCLEFAELDWNRTELARVKNFLTSPIDDFRPPYGRANVRVPRRCVFAGTVNPEATGYFRDATGNRRFWPVLCGKVGPIDLDALGRDRQLLWAEARELYRCHERWWPVGEENALCAEEQNQRMTEDAWETLVTNWLGSRAPGVRVAVGDVLADVLKLERGKWDQVSQNRAARALQSAGWARRRFTVNSERVWLYEKEAVPVDQSTAHSTDQVGQV